MVVFVINDYQTLFTDFFMINYMKAYDALDEAKYFLDMMKENIDDLNKFKYNLDAFIQTGRNVTFHLQREFKKNPEFNSWYVIEQENMSKDPLFCFFTKTRNFVVKEEQITVKGHHELSFSLNAFLATKYEIELENANGTKQKIISSEPKPQEKIQTSNIKRRWYFTNFYGKEAEVIPLCLEYIKRLESLLKEAEKNI